MQAATQGQVSLEEAFRAFTISRNTSAADSTAIFTPASTSAPLETPDTPYDLRDSNERDVQNEKQSAYVSDELTVRALPPHLASTGKHKLDHSTIFVGGLEMYGPNAWNEDRVQQVFGQYGEIENIKFIRPSATFSFVLYLELV